MSVRKDKPINDPKLNPGIAAAHGKVVDSTPDKPISKQLEKSPGDDRPADRGACEKESLSQGGEFRKPAEPK